MQQAVCAGKRQHTFNEPTTTHNDVMLAARSSYHARFANRNDEAPDEEHHEYALTQTPNLMVGVNIMGTVIDVDVSFVLDRSSSLLIVARQWVLD